MYKSRLFWLLILQLIYTTINAQGEANNWYFGENAGLNFNSGSPVALTNGQVNSIEGSAVMSDASGNLLFYTDGATVWNRNHEVLQNGTGLLGEQSSTQSALIIQKPGSNHIYYIFTTSQAQRFFDWFFCYSEVDMNLDGGLGAITSIKNVQLFEPIGEKITAVKHANGQDIWVLTHDKFTNKYLTYSVTSAGVNPTPIIFTGGTIDNGSENIGVIIYSPNRGQIKASPDGTKIACAFSNVNKVDLLDFDNATGQLTYRFTINQVVTPYAVEFSPNGSLLYVTGYDNPTLRQYNLTLPTPAQIIASSYSFPNMYGTVTWGMQMGPDEKIYLRSGEPNWLNRIENPDEIGLNCIYTINAVPLDGRLVELGFPNFPNFYLTQSGIEYLGSCEDDSTFFSFNNAMGFDSIFWNFGDPSSGITNTSDEFSPTHVYQNQGTYTVTVTYFINGQSFSIQKSILIIGIPNISLGPDTFFCSDNYNVLPINVEDSFSNTQFSFSDGIFRKFTGVFYAWQEGNQWLTATNGCGSGSDTFFVDAISAPQPFSLYGDQALCEGTSYFIGTLPAVGNYLWQDGSTEPEHLLSEAGEYYVTVSNQCGAQSDTMLITEIIPLPSVDLGNDTTICEGSIPPLILTPQGVFNYYGWQNPGVFGPVIVTESETYAVSVYNACGVASDTIQVIVDTIAPATLDLGEDTFICEGESLTVSIDQPGVSFLWNDGSTDSVFTTSISALIIGSALNACGQQSDTLQVFYFPLPEVSVGPNINTCDAEEVTLTANSNTNNYAWQNGSTQNTINVNTSGWYWVNTSNNCGTATDSVFVQMRESTSETLILNSCKLVSLNGIEYSQSGTYTQTFVNSSGCDSILTIEAEILNVDAQVFQTDTSYYFNGNPTSIQWFNCITGQVIPGATQTNFTPEQPGYYGAIVNLGSCSDTSNCLITSAFPFTQKSKYFCDNLTLSPNPANDYVSFTLEKESYPIRLFSASGAVLWQKTGSSEKQEISLAHLPPAMYVLQVDACRFKIVKQ